MGIQEQAAFLDPIQTNQNFIFYVMVKCGNCTCVDVKIRYEVWGRLADDEVFKL